MPSTFSPDLRIELIGSGEQQGVWGTTTNTNLGTLIEDAISGYVSVSVTSAAQAFTANDGAADQARNATIALTTTTTADFAVYAPPASKQYIIYNTTAYVATIYNSTVLGNTTAAGAGVAVAAGRKIGVFSDGTNFHSLGILPITDGGTGASTASAARSSLGLAIGTNVQAWDAELDVWATKTAPTGTAVGTTDTQTLTNKTLDGGTIVTANSASDALRITQLGAGNALVVEDSTNPDASPFVVSGTGNVAISQTTALCPLDVNGVTFFRGVKYSSQDTPIAKTAAATLTVAELLNGIITCGGFTATLTMPTGSDLDSSLLASLPVNGAFEFSIINIGGTTCTLGTSTGVTIVGYAGIPTGNNSSGTFKVRKTATATYVLYRIN